MEGRRRNMLASDYHYNYYVKEMESESENENESEWKVTKRKENVTHRDSLICEEDDLTSLSSPPTKIRRLNLEFSPRPVMLHGEHEDADEDWLLQQQTKTSDFSTASVMDVNVMNEESALVLYQPMPVAHAHLLAVAGQVVSYDAVVTNEEESLAVVPWAPNKLNWDQSQEEEICSMKMEVEDEGEREQKRVIVNENNKHHHYQWQWQQNQNHKHCMAAPQFPLNSAAPATAVTWSSC